jgi:hypothetical protein
MDSIRLVSSTRNVVIGVSIVELISSNMHKRLSMQLLLQARETRRPHPESKPSSRLKQRHYSGCFFYLGSGNKSQSILSLTDGGE